MIYLISFFIWFNKTGKFLFMFRRKAASSQKLWISFKYSISDFAHYKVFEWKMIKISLHLSFVLQIRAFVESLEEEEDFLGVICTFQ